MAQIKIAFIASTLTVGGSERVLYDIFSRLPEGRFTSRLYLLKDPGPIGRKLLQAGFEGASELQRKRFDPSVLIRLALHFKRFSPHILFSLDHHNAMFWGRLASLLAGVPSRVVASHATGRFGGKKSFNFIDRILMNSTDAVIALSESHASYLRDHEGMESSKVRIIENGVDIDRFENIGAGSLDSLKKQLHIRDGEKIVIMIAALRPEKAHEALLEAAKKVSSSISDVRFLIVGGGARREQLEAMSSQLGLERCVEFLGERSDIPELLGLSHVLVLPSHSVVETLPLVVLEAMASGLPVIASAVGSIPDVIENGENGILIPPADHDALAEAIIFVLSKRGAGGPIKKMTAKAQMLVKKKYTVTAMVHKYQELFEELYRKKP